MGYSASCVEKTDNIVVPKERFYDFATGLLGTTEEGKWGRISTDLAHRMSAGVMLGAAIGELLEEALLDIGFDGVTLWKDGMPEHGIAQPGDLVIESWCGEKIPYDWDEIWTAIAAVAKNPVDWIFIGEDDDRWAHCIDGKGNLTNRTVKLIVDRTGEEVGVGS